MGTSVPSSQDEQVVEGVAANCGEESGGWKGFRSTCISPVNCWNCWSYIHPVLSLLVNQFGERRRAPPCRLGRNWQQKGK